VTTVRIAAHRRQRQRARHAAAARYATLSRETGVPIEVLRTFARISDPRNAHRFTVAAFHARGERAWQQYLRTQQARTVDEVFDRIDALVEARRRESQWFVGTELARGATNLRSPSSPPVEDWEPPRYELQVRPADLDN